MRTTINLPDQLAEVAKERAAREGRTFTSLVEDGLRAVLLCDDTAVHATPLPAFGEPGGGFLIELADREAVWAALDDLPR